MKGLNPSPYPFLLLCPWIDVCYRLILMFPSIILDSFVVKDIYDAPISLLLILRMVLFHHVVTE